MEKWTSWRDELGTLVARYQQLKAENAKLRVEIAALSGSSEEVEVEEEAVIPAVFAPPSP
jgi:uncharacterized protein (DUF3084 family)